MNLLLASAVTSAENWFGIEVIADDHQRAAPTARLNLRDRLMLESRQLRCKLSAPVEVGKSVGSRLVGDIQYRLPKDYFC